MGIVVKLVKGPIIVLPVGFGIVNTLTGLRGSVEVVVRVMSMVVVRVTVDVRLLGVRCSRAGLVIAHVVVWGC